MTVNESNQVPFSDLELRNIVFNAMGRTSEAGNAVVFQLGYASNIVENNLPSYKNKNNSGLTLGHMQMDYAANPSQIPKFLDAYDAWAKESNQPIISNRQEATRLLSQNRNTVFSALKSEYNSWASENNKPLSTDNIKTPTGRGHLLKLINDNELLAEFQRTNPATKFTDIRINNHPFGLQLRTFLESDAGYDYVMSPQVAAFNNIEVSLQQAMAKPSFLAMNHEEQVQILATISKIVNQSGHDMRVIKFLDGETTFGDFKTKTLDHLEQANGVVHSGVVKTLRGTEVYNKLSSDSGILGDIFREKLLEDPYLLTKSQFMTDPNEQLMDSLFRYPDKTASIINAVNNNKDYIIEPKTWLREDISKEDMQSEVYAIGVKDGVLFSIYKDGTAHKLDGNGQWIAFNNKENPLVHRGPDGHWTTKPRDLTENHKGPDVLELQEKLNALGHPVTINDKEPTYDQATTDQVKAFQEAHGLTTSGKIDGATRTAMDNQLNEQNKHLPFVRSDNGQTEQQITAKLAEIDKLNEQLKGYDPIRDIGEIAKTEADLGQMRTEVAQLELVRQSALDTRKHSLQNEQLGLRGQEAAEGQEKQIGAIEIAQTQQNNAQALVDALKSDPATEQRTIDTLATKANVTVVTPAEQALAGKEPFKSTDTASVSALQDVLYERKLMTSTARGYLGNQTKAALRTALGLPADHDFKEGITQEMLDQLKPTEAMIEARANEGLTKASTQVTTLEARANAIDQSLADIEARRPSIIDQQIIKETTNIEKLQNDIKNYDQDKLDPLKNIQGKLTEHTQNSANNSGEDSANNTSTTPYQAVEKELTAANISVLTPEQNAFFNSTKGGKSNNIDDVKTVQTYLIEKGYLAETWTDKKGDVHPSNDGDFGGGTTKAIKAYQLAHGLKERGVIDADFRAAMKADVLNQLTAEEINQKVQAELDTRTEHKETALTEMNNEIKDTQTHIDQLHIEQTTLLTNQLTIQQEKQQELTDKIKQNQEAVKNIDTLKTTIPLDATLADPAHEAALKAQGIELEKRPPESAIHALLDEKKTALEADIKSDQAQLETLKPAIEKTKVQLAEREIKPSEKDAEKDLEAPSQELKEPVAAQSDPEVTQFTTPEAEKEKIATVDNPDLERKEPTVEVKADPQESQSPVSEETKETVEAKPWTSGDKQFDALCAAAALDGFDALRAVCKEIRYSEFGQKFQAETDQLHQLEQQQLEQTRQQQLLEQQQREQAQLAKQNQGPSIGR